MGAIQVCFLDNGATLVCSLDNGKFINSVLIFMDATIIWLFIMIMTKVYLINEKVS
jgi:hypothetical protein